MSVLYRERHPNRRVNDVRERTPKEWWKRAAEVFDAEAQTYPLWGGDFFAYFGQAAPLHVIDYQTVDHVGMAMFEAARSAAFDVLLDYCEQILPIAVQLSALRASGLPGA